MTACYKNKANDGGYSFEENKRDDFLEQFKRQDADRFHYHRSLSVFYTDIIFLYQYCTDCQRERGGYDAVESPADKE